MLWEPRDQLAPEMRATAPDPESAPASGVRYSALALSPQWGRGMERAQGAPGGLAALSAVLTALSAVLTAAGYKTRHLSPPHTGAVGSGLPACTGRTHLR